MNKKNLKKTIAILIVLILTGVLYGTWRSFRSGLTSVKPEISDIQGARAGEAVAYGEGRVGYLATPEGEGPFPALILIHEWWGLNDNIRDLADDFAKEGYVALAVDLYDGRNAGYDPAAARKLATEVRANTEPAFANLSDAVNYLKARDDVNPESLASVGWCFGGGWAYQMAKNDLGVEASIMYYGAFNTDDDLSQMRADILGHFGEDDTSIKVDDVVQFDAKLQTLSGDHRIFIYPNAGHAFANIDNEASYVPKAAEAAWARTLEFLNEELR